MAEQNHLASTEWVDIVNENNEVIAQSSREQMRAQCLRHRATYIVVHDGMGKILVQRRTETKDFHPGMLDATAGGVVQAVAGNPNAIGYIGVGYLDSQIKGLVVNGVQPGAKTAQDGTWPISRELYLFTSGQPQGDAKKLVDYTLSAEGQQFVSKSGFVPLK